MITVISGTNRPKNLTLKVAQHIEKKLKNAGEQVQLLNLEDLPFDFQFSGLYGAKNEVFKSVVETYFEKVQHFIIVSPEYNGSFPGILKSFIEAWNPKISPGKRVALVGVASGRQGNSRGMDHLTNILNYLNMEVVPLKLPISKIYEFLDENGEIADEEINRVLEKQFALLKP